MENKPFYKKTWFFVVCGLIVVGLIGKSLEKEPPRDYITEANQLFEKIQNPTSTEQLNIDIQSAKKLYEDMKLQKDSSNEFILAEMNLEAVVKLKDQTLKNSEQTIRIKKLQDEWNGGFTVINKAIKSQMHDPGSFEHVNTQYKVKEGKIITYTEYRGKNAYGAKVLGNVAAEIDMDGNILEFKAGE